MKGSFVNKELNDCQKAERREKLWMFGFVRIFGREVLCLFDLHATQLQYKKNFRASLFKYRVQDF